MADTNNLIKIGDSWYFQVGYAALDLEEDTSYCLQRTDKKNVLKFVKIDGGSGAPVDAYTKKEADAKFSTKEELTILKPVIDAKVVQELEGSQSGDKAKIQNQTDGGVMQYVKKDGSIYAVTVNDGSQDVCAEMCAIDGDSQGSRILVNTTGAYYNVDNKISINADDEIATKKDVKNYIPITVKEGSNTSYMANEKDGGLIKYTKEDGSYAKVTLCNIDENAVAQIVATDKSKTTFAKIDARKDGICYSKKTGNPNIEEDELVVKKDLANFVTQDAIAEKADKSEIADVVKQDTIADMATKTWAQATFVSQEEGLDDYYAKGDADAKFLDKTTAESTYLSKTTAESTYCTTDYANQTYFTKTDALNVAMKTQIDTLTEQLTQLTTRVKALEDAQTG